MTIRSWPTLTALAFCVCLLSWVSSIKAQNPTCVDYSKDPAGCQPSTFDTPLDKMKLVWQTSDVVFADGSRMSLSAP